MFRWEGLYSASLVPWRDVIWTWVCDWLTVTLPGKQNYCITLNCVSCWNSEPCGTLFSCRDRVVEPVNAPPEPSDRARVCTWLCLSRQDLPVSVNSFPSATISTSDRTLHGWRTEMTHSVTHRDYQKFFFFTLCFLSSCKCSVMLDNYWQQVSSSWVITVQLLHSL